MAENQGGNSINIGGNVTDSKIVGGDDHSTNVGGGNSGIVNTGTITVNTGPAGDHGEAGGGILNWLANRKVQAVLALIGVLVAIVALYFDSKGDKPATKSSGDTIIIQGDNNGAVVKGKGNTTTIRQPEKK